MGGGCLGTSCWADAKPWGDNGLGEPEHGRAEHGLVGGTKSSGTTTHPHLPFCLVSHTVPQ